MDDKQNEGLFRIRQFPPVVHPRHARELLATPTDVLLAEWVGGYAMTTPEHRQMLEDLLSSLAWKETGAASLVQGLYGTGKSHLLVLLHLLCALPDSWTPLLETHPTFRRYQRAIQHRRFLVIHFSLDEYAPQHALEETLKHEIERALGQAHLPVPVIWHTALSRLDAWTALLEVIREAGYQGFLLLVDEMSLFLAGKTPAQREADAAFLQFLAETAARFPLWLTGALQRNLSDVGALRTHSWRQVEDRFRRYALSPQEIGNILRDKLMVRIDPSAIRAVITDSIVPAGEAHDVPYSAGDFQLYWPFHPAALNLLVEVTNSFLSPHRSMVQVLQQIGGTAWPQRPPEHLITPLDLLSLVVEDLRSDERLHKLWKAAALLENHVNDAPDPALTRHCLDLLILLHLANQSTTVRHIRGLLFDGATAPSIAQISHALHFLRRRGAYLSVVRDSQPEQEVFSLAIGDEIGAMALARMQEIRQEFSPDDPRIIETAMQAGSQADWPFGAALHGINIPVTWYGERLVQVSLLQTISATDIARFFAGVLAGNADGCVLLDWPGNTATPDIWRSATQVLDGPHAAVFFCWQPRLLTVEENELWAEYACWQRAAEMDAATSQQKQVSRRCRERAEELRPAVEDVAKAIYLEGAWHSAGGEQGSPISGTSLADLLVGMIAPGFGHLFPFAQEFSAHGVPAPAVCRQLLQHFFTPGEILLAPYSLLGEYIEQFAVPLGCVEVHGQTAHVVPPRREITEVLAAAAGPLRITDVLSLLKKPPLGLTHEQGRLALAAALQSGLLQGLDAFLQPVGTDAQSALSDTVVFAGPPTVIDEAYRPCIESLASHWSIPQDSWPVACSQVDRRLREWLALWEERLPAMRAAQADWGECLAVYPWGWRTTETLLDTLAMATGSILPLEQALDAIGRDGTLITRAELLWEATRWWQAKSTQISMLACAALPDPFRKNFEIIRAQLSAGEEAFPNLPRIDEQLDAVLAAFSKFYHQWHEGVFGMATVTALREAFDRADFRAVKALSRLPLPLPGAASRCLEALAQARAQYCPGALSMLHEEGCCTHCRLPLGSPTPMPDAAALNEIAAHGVREYAELLAAHPWSVDIRCQLSRAPEEIATRGLALFNWHVEEGAQRLLEILDDRLIAWLCRDHHTVGVRRVTEVGARLRGRDLSLVEVQATIRDWLDPEHALAEDALLSFE